MTPQRAIVPVLAFGKDITALGVIRAFGRRGIPCSLASSPGNLATHSRWYKPAERPIEETIEPEVLEDYLTGLSLNRAVLMPCSDRWATCVSRLSPPVLGRFASSISKPEVLDLFVDKAAFARLLESHTVPHPRTVNADAEESLEHVSEDILPGFFLKPRDSKRCTEVFGTKAFFFADRQAMHEQWRQMQDAGCGAVLQEYVPGSPAAHYFIDGFIDREGVVRAVFARRRLRIFPPDFGNSTAMVSVPSERVAQGRNDLLRLLGGVGYRGIYSAEFKLDERDGLLKLLEVNARPWWYVEFAALCGVDVCDLAYRDALGERLVTIQEYTVGKRYALASLDLEALLDLRRRGEIGRRAWLVESARALKGGRPLDDPLPAVASALSLAHKAWRRYRLETGRRKHLDAD